MPRILVELDIVLASPSDVRIDCEIIEEAIEEWNHQHSESFRLRFRSTRWENDAAPLWGETAQDSINRQMIDQADGLFALFWSRLGRPTLQHKSGTLEEIHRAVARGIPLSIFHCTKSVCPSKLDLDQFNQLTQTLEQLRERGFVAQYDSDQALKRRTTHLLSKLAKSFREQVTEYDAEATDASSMESYLEAQQIKEAADEIRFLRRQVTVVAEALLVDSEWRSEDPLFEGSEVQHLFKRVEGLLCRLPDGAYAQIQHLVSKLGRTARPVSNFFSAPATLEDFLNNHLEDATNQISEIENALSIQLAAVKSGAPMLRSRNF